MIRWIAAFFVALACFANNAMAQAQCVNSNDDETIIEYFNEIKFEDLIEIIIVETSSYNVGISCPERESSNYPPSDFYLAMLNSYTNTPVASCDGNTQTFDLSRDAKNLALCPNWPRCDFKIVLQNRTTKTIYSETEYQIEVGPGNRTLLPALEAATIQICNNTINNCILDNTCSLSTQHFGTLQLCESASSCVSPPNSNSYEYNENEYLQGGSKA